MDKHTTLIREIRELEIISVRLISLYNRIMDRETCNGEDGDEERFESLNELLDAGPKKLSMFRNRTLGQISEIEDTLFGSNENEKSVEKYNG